MIQCNPQGICSSDYYLSGGHNGFAEFQWLGEAGAIGIDERIYQIQKAGLFQSAWTMSGMSRPVAHGRKTSIFTRTMEIESASGLFTLEAVSPFTRAMRLRGPGCDAAIAPVHPFTRRAVIDGEWQDHDVETVFFAFWLAATLWRRQRRNSSSNAGGAG